MYYKSLRFFIGAFFVVISVGSAAEVCNVSLKDVSLPASPVSDEGTEPHPSLIERKFLPKGAALLTSSGNLRAKGIGHIIHAAIGNPATLDGTEELTKPTAISIFSSLYNSLELARRFKHKRVAVSFLGREYLNALGISADALAKHLLTTALRHRGDLEIRFVLSEEDHARFVAVYENIIEKKPKLAKGLSKDSFHIIKGAITDFDSHGGSVIVYTANLGASWGEDIIPKAIGRETGNDRAIEIEVYTSIVKYNQDLSSRK